MQDIRPMSWFVEALRVAWRHKGLFSACGAALAAADVLLELVLPMRADAADPGLSGALRSILPWMLSGALGVLAYRGALRRVRPVPHPHAWAALPLAMLRGALVQGLAAAIVALTVGLLSALALAALSAWTGTVLGPGAEAGAIMSLRLMAGNVAAIPVLLALCLAGTPLALLLELAAALAMGEVATTTRSGVASFLFALRVAWPYKYRLALPAYAIAVVAVLVFATLVAALPSGEWSARLLTAAGFAWWAGFIVVANAAFRPSFATQ